MIFYDLDRLVRQPRDLEDLIDIVEYVKRPITGATGGRMNLINDSDRHMARMMCVRALKSSEDTARRVARQHLSAAQNGLTQGRIAYGWIRKGERKGQLVPSGNAAAGRDLGVALLPLAGPPPSSAPSSAPPHPHSSLRLGTAVRAASRSTPRSNGVHHLLKADGRLPIRIGRSVRGS
ncbi:hypothetical protein STRMOE7_02045 [Streptomyces sp. MOE7]|nr:hypothetical protein STRMOE7_02045 [Streptomyces sp. MOE7]